jgi:hypothetical protein
MSSADRFQLIVVVLLASIATSLFNLQRQKSRRD